MAIKKKAIIFTIVIIFIGIVLFFIIPSGEPEISVYKVCFVIENMTELIATAFMAIINDGKGSDKLLGCSVEEFPSSWCELHDIVGNRMKKVKKITIPIDGIVVIEEGKHHLMIYNIHKKFDTEEVTILLNFKRSGIIEVKAPVKF